MDVNTEHPDVISQLQAWIPEYVKTFGIDGLRIDGMSIQSLLSEVVQADWIQLPSTSEAISGLDSAEHLESSVSVKSMVTTCSESPRVN